MAIKVETDLELSIFIESEVVDEPESEPEVAAELEPEPTIDEPEPESKVAA